MKNLLIALAICFSSAIQAQTVIGPPLENPVHNTIQLALLLDVSNSMDGLIDQAKAELWSIVNEASKASKNGHAARLEIALFEYGRSTLTLQSGYVRKLVDYTTDLDTISEVLFSLKTAGGDEYCGEVIQKSLAELKWQDNTNMYRVIFIAGNEPFNQGKLTYNSACANASEKRIIINTIHCGDSLQGVKEFWKEGATIGQGEYFYINQNATSFIQVETPYDSLIQLYNDSLNTTYMGYGKMGTYYWSNQLKQDKNAKTMSKEVAIKRAETKSKKSSYSNKKWDVVDASTADSTWIKNTKDEDLPEVMKGKTIDEKKIIIKGNDTRRIYYSQQIALLNKQRQAFLANIKRNKPAERTLGTALIKAIRSQAMAKGFVFTD
ncbi:MAG: VWA domain-containing protein [bacterium]|nr:VWA domain-containing protein [bacterium]